jgi:hypothetical protein
MTIYFLGRRSTVKSDSSYSFQFNEMARPARLELATLCLEGRRSIQLSYGRLIDSKTLMAPQTTICYVFSERLKTATKSWNCHRNLVCIGDSCTSGEINLIPSTRAKSRHRGTLASPRSERKSTN